MNMRAIFTKYYYEILFVCIAIIVISLQSHYLNYYPRSIHAWAQSDMFAIVKGYLNNGFDLFHPEGLVYNKQYPYLWDHSYNSTITGGNLPIHQYIIAILMKLSGSESPFIFRSYILTFSLIGIFYLLRIAKLFQTNYGVTILIVSTALFSPIYCYYQANFLIVIPCAATTFISLYYYFSYLKTGKLYHWNLAILILSITLIARTTYAIPLVAVLSHQFLIFLQERKFNLKKLIVVGIMLVIWLAITIHSNQLSEKYGSYFLTEIAPATNLNHFFLLASDALDFWNWNYFSKTQVTIFVILFTISLFFIRKKHIKNVKGVGYFALILMIGYILFAYAMARQFHDHDYYFIDTFYIFFLVLMLGTFSLIKVKRLYINIILMLTSIYFFKNYKNETKQTLAGRYDYIPEYDYTTKSSISFEESIDFMKTFTIESDAKIAVLGCEASNLPYLFIGKKGYAINYYQESTYNRLSNWKIDYVYCSNDLIDNKIKKDYPYVLERLKPIKTNNKITLFKVIK